MSVSPKAFPAITQEQLRRYAEASGDPNPIHLDEAVAKKAGLPGVIAHGMLVAALIAERAREHAGPEWRLARFQTRFKAMTLLGEVLSIGGVEKDGANGEKTLELEARNAAGEVKASAQAKFERKRA